MNGGYDMSRATIADLFLSVRRQQAYDAYSNELEADLDEREAILEQLLANYQKIEVSHSVQKLSTLS